MVIPRLTPRRPLRCNPTCIWSWRCLKKYPDRNTMNVLSCAYRNTLCCFVSLQLRANALCVFEWNQRRGSRRPSAGPAGTKALLPVGPFCRAGPSWPNELRRETWGMMDGNPQWFLCQDCFQWLLILGIWILSLTWGWWRSPSKIKQLKKLAHGAFVN